MRGVWWHQTFSSLLHGVQMTTSKDEIAWVRDTLMALLRRIGFRRVDFTHGILEAGRDVVFSDYDKFGLVKYYAAQAKDGDLRSRSDTQEIRTILEQLRNAYETPYRDVTTGTEHRIAGVYLIVNGTVSDAAKQILYSRTGSWMSIVDRSQFDVADTFTVHVRDSDRRIAYGFLGLEIRRNKETLADAFACADGSDSTGAGGEMRSMPMPCRLLSIRWLVKCLDIALYELHPDDIHFLSCLLRWSEDINFLLHKIPLGAIDQLINPSVETIRRKISEYSELAPIALEAIEFALNSERPEPGEHLDLSPSVQQYLERIRADREPGEHA